MRPLSVSNINELIMAARGIALGRILRLCRGFGKLWMSLLAKGREGQHTFVILVQPNASLPVDAEIRVGDAEIRVGGQGRAAGTSQSEGSRAGRAVEGSVFPERAPKSVGLEEKTTWSFGQKLGETPGYTRLIMRKNDSARR